MIVILWSVVLIAAIVISYGLGIATGKATERRRISALKRRIYEVDKFARQQSAVGDDTGTVITDMLHEPYDNEKELN